MPMLYRHTPTPAPQAPLLLSPLSPSKATGRGTESGRKFPAGQRCGDCMGSVEPIRFEPTFTMAIKFNQIETLEA